MTFQIDDLWVVIIFELADIDKSLPRSSFVAPSIEGWMEECLTSCVVS